MVQFVLEINNHAVYIVSCCSMTTFILSICLCIYLLIGCGGWDGSYHFVSMDSLCFFLRRWFSFEVFLKHGWAATFILHADPEVTYLIYGIYFFIEIISYLFLHAPIH